MKIFGQSLPVTIIDECIMSRPPAVFGTIVSPNAHTVRPSGISVEYAPSPPAHPMFDMLANSVVS